MSDAACFHCGEPIPRGVDFFIRIESTPRALCCRGCQAVAQAIVDNGLADYYKNRTQLPQRGHELLPAELEQLRLYDHPQIQKSFVLESGAHLKQAVLILEGITCAACVWLNERHLLQLPGVKSVQVNYGSHRARVSWDEREINLSRILAEIQLLGYQAHPYNAQSAAALREKRHKKDLRRLAIAGISAAQVMMFAVALYAGAWYGMEAGTAGLLRWASLTLTLPVMFYAAQPFYSAAGSALRSRHLNMDVPVVIALVSAFVGSVYNTLLGAGHVYFDAISMFTLFLLGTRLLEQNARERSVEAAENLLKLAPAMATRVSDAGQQCVPVLELIPGDRLLVKPGEAFPADGTVESGASAVDEALLTGESRPVAKLVGSGVIAGSINLDSPLTMIVTGIGEHTVLASIVRMLDHALAEKPRLAQLADRVSGYFTWALLGVTLLVGLAWWAVEADRAFEIVLALLVVTCPCALSLAAPAALAAAGSHLLRRGVLITRGHALETLAQVTRVVFDKTGTLTVGKPVLQATQALAELDAARCLQLAASLEQASEHPLAQPFLACVKPTELLPVSDARNELGRGVSGDVEGRRYYIGRTELAGHVTQSSTDSGMTQVWLADESRLLARFELADALRNDAKALVDMLKARGMKLSILSGDDPATVRHIGDQLGIDDCRGGLKPADKLAALQAMQAAGEVVMMLGDGVNDAPVLAAAQVSLAMGGGTQVARATSDIVLLSERLPEVGHALNVSRLAMSIMRQNFAWAIAYNLIAVPVAALGLVSPWLAAIGMSASSLIVVVNALRLR
ncbi:MAG: cadmium-translocating P-type ATPase [Burkholderiales bacterium]|nr:cadmium-translocating P-type ATPase [Burkholderiales bacterium]